MGKWSERDLDVTVFSAANNREPQPSWNQNSTNAIFSDILGQPEFDRDPQTSRAMTFESNSILSEMELLSKC